MKTLLLTAQLISVSALLAFLLLSQTLPVDIRWLLVLMMLFVVFVVFASVIWYMYCEASESCRDRGASMLSRRQLVEVYTLLARDKARLR